jgi:hypothetical protein
LKIDKYIRDLSKRLDNNNNDDDNEIIFKDDDYYLDRGDNPPWFTYHSIAIRERREALGGHHHKLGNHEYDHSITQDQLDYILKRELRPSPEQRYQHEKANFLFHDLGCYMRRLNDTEYGCTGAGCIPECRFYPETGRIEDEEVIEEHNKLIESLRHENSIVEPPSESELLKIAKVYCFP